MVPSTRAASASSRAARVPGRRRGELHHPAKAPTTAAVRRSRPPLHTGRASNKTTSTLSPPLRSRERSRVSSGPRASRRRAGRRDARSEEHTSELQSHVNLVCRLLLEKKKKTENTTSEYQQQ